MSNKSLAVIVVIIILGGLNIVQFSIFTLPQFSEENAVLDVKMILEGDKGEIVGKTKTLDGYYIEGGGNISLLITDPLVFENNSLTPSTYLMIGGSIPSSLQGQQGARVHVTGKISWADVEEGLLSISLIKFKLVEEPVLMHLDNKFFDPTALQEGITILPYLQNKYAVLISGGINPENAYSRYWNDITAMYFILTWFYGYDPANIYVVYKDGIAENNFAPVHGPATHGYLFSVFGELKDRMTRLDDLFVFTTNHGGSAGLSLWAPLDPYPLTPSKLNIMLHGIDCRKQIIVMGQCNSGVFIPTLSRAGRMILTACSPVGYSYACDLEGDWDEFAFHFMSAVIQQNINGDDFVVDSDTSGDGKVSMYEAFIYASDHDSRPETPFYDDDGDGSAVISFFLQYVDPTDEGLFGMNTFL